MNKVYQFLFHLALFKILIPASVMMIQANLVGIFCWDISGEWIEWDSQPYFKYTHTDPPLPGLIEELGYE